GLVFALCLTWVLVRRRMFHLERLLSPAVFLLISMTAFLILALYSVPRLVRSIADFTGAMSDGVLMFTVTTVVLATGAAYAFFHRLFYAIFSKGERQSQALGRYSKAVSQTLSTREIAGLLTDYIRRAYGAGCHVLLEADGQFAAAPGMADPAAHTALHVAFNANALCVRHFAAGESALFTNHFTTSPHYTARDQNEYCLLKEQNIELVLALKNGAEVVGLMLLPSRGRRACTETELDLLQTTASITAIAIKNAVLYERIYREARMDHLTGLFSYNHFIGQVEAMAADGHTDPLALLYLDIDDMKLFNQLYGTETGDSVLQKIAEAIRVEMGSRGLAFRHSGKVFALLLPGFTADTACQLAAKIQRRVRDFSAKLVAGSARGVSISGGVCTFPDVAKDARQLMEYADIAVYNAKTGGKGKIEVFHASWPAESQKVVSQAKRIISQAEQRGFSYFSSYSATVLALTAAIDAKDHYTYAHSQNVAHYASVLAVAVGLTEAQVRLVYEAALLHDIGKISIPETILGKQGDLTDEERELMKTHVENSIEIIRHLPSMDYVIPVAIAHHERWDGLGYPRALAGEEIPMAARCLAVADTFDAMTSDRTYRLRLPLKTALRELESNAGKQFDPYVVNVFISLVHRGEIVLQNQAAAS
ncbi:diguanylate cyclase, partial [Ruminococcaceae bacterium OttesenSCG-928-A11]|nr:diguanylate cyclase [Ruminococcaceae bacterium OttesenSCG-928-A11]